jgi:hypothetical protein
MVCLPYYIVAKSIRYLGKKEYPFLILSVWAFGTLLLQLDIAFLKLKGPLPEEASNKQQQTSVWTDNLQNKDYVFSFLAAIFYNIR